MRAPPRAVSLRFLHDFGVSKSQSPRMLERSARDPGIGVRRRVLTRLRRCLSQHLRSVKKRPPTMPSRGPYGKGPAGGEVLASQSEVQLQSDPNRGKVTAHHRRSWHWTGKASEVRWKNKYLLPGTIVLVIYTVMGYWLHVPFRLSFAIFATEPVAGQCPSYTEYSKVVTQISCPHRH